MPNRSLGYSDVGNGFSISGQFIMRNHLQTRIFYLHLACQFSTALLVVIRKIVWRLVEQVDSSRRS
uniref:Uncharacterized protein n=1 Tax=Arundo donax TaxID=35708 RepID=A0A0A9BLU7_ARUDO